MRILLITPRPDSVGGIARWTEAFLNYSHEKFDAEIVDNSLLPSKKSKISVIFSQVKRTASILSNLSKKIKAQTVDVAHINSSCTKLGVIRDYLCARKIAKNGIPIVLQCHCNIVDQLGTSRISNFYFKKLVCISERVFVLNRKSLDFVKIVSGEKGEICPNFIAKERVLTAPKSISEDIGQITYVGHMYKSKGVFEVLELAKAFPDISFKLVGPCTELLETKTDIPQNVFFTGPLDADGVIRVLDESDVFVLLSYSEGFSNAMLEAMARGLPILATDVGAARDMIEGNGGVIVAPDDRQAAKTAIEYMRPKSIREQMSVGNLEKVRKEYTSEAVLVKLEGIYASIAKQDFHVED